MSRTAKTYTTWLLSALVGTSLALGGQLAVAADKAAKPAADARDRAERRADVKPIAGWHILCD